MTPELDLSLIHCGDRDCVVPCGQCGPIGGDPFTSAPDATAADCDIRRRAFNRPEATCDVASKPRKRKTDLNPLQKRWFEANGYIFARVEHANAFGGVTVDLWGFADYLACKPGEGVLLVQTCTHGDASKRVRKAISKPELRPWLESGGRFTVHGWLQKGGPGTRWEVIERALTLEDVREVAAARRPGSRGETR